ncbi:MAG: conserved phage C-terminal domain-containing protein [Syntrophobacteraceae bacterium]
MVDKKPESRTGKPQEVIPYEAIIGRLNERTGKSFSARLPATMRQIKARWREGFRLTDFEQVIDIKAAKWGADPKMQDYLRPKRSLAPTSRPT